MTHFVKRSLLCLTVAATLASASADAAKKVAASKDIVDTAVAAGSFKTLQGDSVSITVTGQAAMVNGAKLISTDLDASNGVIHVIDSVLLPPVEKQAALQPRQMIESAIHEGAPLFNAGHATECAQVYMTTVKGLLAMEDHGLCPSTMTTLKTALHKAESTGCHNTQAWTLRHALDSAYTSMVQVSR